MSGRDCYSAFLFTAFFVTACGAQDSADGEYRYWTARNNRRSDVPLRLVEQTETHVRLKREDNGTVVELRIAQLSRGDQEYLRQRKRERSASAGADRDDSPGWPRFRGPGGSGRSPDEKIPLEWSATRNTAWRTALPGPGTSSPIVYGRYIYVTSYSGYGLDAERPGDVQRLRRHLLCIDGRGGEILWRKDIPYDRNDRVFQFTGFNALHGFASSTPVADESGVFVYFGTSGASHYSHDGELQWNRKLGDDINGWGTATSPILFEDLLIVHADIEAHALIALNKKTGAEVWRMPSGAPDSWSTPLIVEHAGGHELVFHHSRGQPSGILAAIDPREGQELWRCNVLRNYLCPSPIAHEGVVYVIAYQRGAAVRIGGRGEVTDSHVLWQNQRGSEICTPVYYEGHLYFSHQESGIAYCIDAKTGETVYQERLTPPSRHIYASGVLAGGRIYYVSRENGTYVVAAQPQFRQLAHNVIADDDSIFNATPAVAGGKLLIRSNQYLHCIAEE